MNQDFDSFTQRSHADELRARDRSHATATDELNKDKELLMAQYDFERNQQRSAHEKHCAELQVAFSFTI
jgi:hypothetical protein